VWLGLRHQRRSPILAKFNADKIREKLNLP
jgi:hypothetical protein